MTTHGAVLVALASASKYVLVVVIVFLPAFLKAIDYPAEPLVPEGVVKGGGSSSSSL